MNVSDRCKVSRWFTAREDNYIHPTLVDTSKENYVTAATLSFALILTILTALTILMHQI